MNKAIVMKILKKNKKIFLLILFLSIPCLFIGSSKVTDEVREKNIKKQHRFSSLTDIVVDMAEELPVEYRAQWRNNAKINIEALLKATTTKYEVALEGNL